MLKRINRIGSARAFEKIFRQGKSIKENGLLLKVKRMNSQQKRFAVVVSTRVSKKAVVRNRIRRILQEALAKELPRLQEGQEAVITVLPGFAAKNFQEAQRALQALFIQSFTQKTP